MSIMELQRQASLSTAGRGHTLVWEEGIGTCIRCPAWVQVDTRPLPNGIDIGGPAIALDCPTECFDYN